MKRFIQRFRNAFNRQYHPYKIPAVLFGVLALAAYLTYVITMTVWYGIDYIGNPSNLIDVLVFGFVFYFLFYYNLTDNSRAFNGFLMFIFMQVWSGVLLFLMNWNASVNLMAAGGVYTIIAIVYLVMLLGIIVGGIFVYIKSRQYLMNRYHKWDVLRNWLIVFVVGVVFVEGLSCYLMIGLGGEFTYDLLVLILPSLGDICLAFVSFFTMMRLKGF